MSSDVLWSGSWKGLLIPVEFLLLAGPDNERSPVLVLVLVLFHDDSPWSLILVLDLSRVLGATL